MLSLIRAEQLVSEFGDVNEVVLAHVACSARYCVAPDLVTQAYEKGMRLLHYEHLLGLSAGYGACNEGRTQIKCEGCSGLWHRITYYLAHAHCTSRHA